VPLEVRADEGADGDHAEPALVEIGERGGDDGVAQPLSLERGVDLGVDQRDGPVPLRVRDLAGKIVPDVELVPVQVRVVHYSRLHPSIMPLG
jgi:hypothetical protein